jgi:D-alanyl-lipoteichoic acid acyltransferase DltB (MBOAT superfamily)
VKSTLSFILLLTIISACADLFAPYRTATLGQVLVDADGRERPVVYGAGGWLTLEDGDAKLLRLRSSVAGVRSAGSFEFDLGDGLLFVARPGRELREVIGAEYRSCAPREAGRLHCKYSFDISPDETIDFGIASGAPRLSAMKLTIMKATVVERINLDSLAYLYAALAILGAVFLWLPFSSGAKAWILVVAGAGWLVLAGGVSGAAALGLTFAVGLALWRLLRGDGQPGRAITLAAAIGVIFVTANVLSSSTAGVFANPGSLPLPVPLGLAFFTIRALELTYRVGTRELTAMTPRDYLLFMLFPATLAAGPIFSLGDFRQGAIARPSVIDWSAGLARMGVGVFKKVVCDAFLVRVLQPKLLALYLDPTGDRVELWLLLIPYALYVYLDFSAYSDIAIGSGRMLGWRVPENFDWPFLRSNLRAFWTKWHMTLSLWVSRWVHFFSAFPLRRAPRVLQLTLPVVTSFLVMGLWHELQATWFLWGLHHASGIMLSDLITAAAATVVLPSILGKFGEGVKRTLGAFAVLFWVSLSHCFTLFTDPAMALALWSHALGFH